MIKIRYEYICDVCRNEIRPVDEFNVSPFMREGIFAPYKSNMVGYLHVCDECLSEANKLLEEKGKFINSVTSNIKEMSK